MTFRVTSRKPGYSKKPVAKMPGKRLASTLPLAWQQKESSHFSWAPYKMVFLFWKGVIVKRSAHKHNTEPIISAPGNGDGIDHWIPQGTLQLQCPRLYQYHPSADGQDKWLY